ncbi:MAG: RpiB/LacA/LacB family sugar-phosphate isomerase [Candidatus Kerfeldbacteria bacterium]|nr:RpiB/LacA/LacB family sugar-phosphate isomerase [Candidatus Kerfeldbacteria bacterium]
MVFVTSDHGGWFQKQKLVGWLRRRGVDVRDLGPNHVDRDDDYPLWAARLARLIQRHPTSRGLLLCRSGVGMAMTANKFVGVRAAQAFTPRMAARARHDDNINVLSLAADYHTSRQLQAMAWAWLQARFRPLRRYRRRLRQVRRIEHGR